MKRGHDKCVSISCLMQIKCRQEPYDAQEEPKAYVVFWCSRPLIHLLIKHDYLLNQFFLFYTKEGNANYFPVMKIKPVPFFFFFKYEDLIGLSCNITSSAFLASDETEFLSKNLETIFNLLDQKSHKVYKTLV